MSRSAPVVRAIRGVVLLIAAILNFHVLHGVPVSENTVFAFRPLKNVDELLREERTNAHGGVTTPEKVYANFGVRVQQAANPTVEKGLLPLLFTIVNSAPGLSP